MPESEADLGGIERALGLTIPRIRLEDFAYGVAPGASQRENAKRSTAKPGNGKRAATKSADGSAEGKNRPRRRRYGKRRT